MSSGHKVSLLDVNVLVALFDPDHVHHEVAHDWFADERDEGWATCAITENGLVRVLSGQSYAGAGGRPADLIIRLRAFCASGHHVYWDRSVSLRDEKLFRQEAMASRQLTDVYLLGLARKLNGRLVTFDENIPLGAVVGATRDHLAVLTPEQA